MGWKTLTKCLFQTEGGLAAEDERYAGMLVRLTFCYSAFSLLLLGASAGLAGTRSDWVGVYTSLVTLFLSLVSYFLARSRYFRLGPWVLNAAILGAIVYSTSRSDIDPGKALMFIPVTFLLSSLVQRVWETTIFCSVCLAAFFLFLVAYPNNVENLQFVFLLCGVMALLIQVFQYQRAKDLKEMLYERAKAVAASRMAELGQVAGGIAHEVNNPLSVILGSCEQALAQTRKPNPQMEVVADRLDRIARMGERIDHIVRSLRNYSREGTPGPKQQVSILGILYSVADLCERRLTSEQVSLKWSVSEPKLRFACRRVQVEQILVNLVTNAADAVGRGGTVHIDMETDAEWVSFIVTDTGPGVPEEVAAKIFEPFFTTKGEDRGTGLGLSISAGLARAQGGSLTLEGQAPHSRFRLRLPRA